MIKLYLVTFCLFSCLHANELRFFTQAELLYYQAQETGLTYAVKSSSPDNLTHAKAQNFTFEWDVGFNVGIGYRIPHDTWQLLLQFTSLQTHCDALKHTQQCFLPLWLGASPLFATGLKAHWRLHFGLIDSLLSKSYHPTPTLTLTPQIGIRWGSARQKLNLEYRGGNFPEDTTVRMKNKFSGIGPLAGITANYALPLNFSLFARTAASLLYGSFYLHQDQDASEKFLGLCYTYHATSPLLEATAGLEWHTKRLTLALAWDQLLFFSQNQFSRLPTPITNQGDLSLSGGRFHIAFSF